MADFPERLRKLRKDNAYTQSEVAKLLHLALDNYKELEKPGRKGISPKVATECANLYNTSVDYIYGRTDDPTDYSNPIVLQEVINQRVKEILKNGHDDSIKYT